MLIIISNISSCALQEIAGNIVLQSELTIHHSLKCSTCSDSKIQQILKIIEALTWVSETACECCKIPQVTPWPKGSNLVAGPVTLRSIFLSQHVNTTRYKFSAI